mgnify:CR=1 FL=1
MKIKFTVVLACLLIGTFFLTSCQEKPEIGQVINYLKIGASSYQACGTIIMTTLQDTDPAKYAKFCEANEHIKTFWNLGIDGLQAYLENKNVGTDAVVINLTSAKVAMRQLFELINLDPALRTYIEASISAVQAITTIILPQVEIVEGQQVDLSDCKITLTCPTGPITVKSIAPYKEDLKVLLSGEPELTPEMENLKKSLGE